MTRIIMLILLMGCTAAVVAQEQERVAAMKPVTSFGYLDVNRDSRISLDEARADWAVAQSFQSADANDDGYLDRDEFAQLMHR